MGRKYIIEIPDDKIGDFIGSTHFLMPYMMAGHIGHHDTGLPIEPYIEPDLEQVRKEAYDNGYETAKHECEDCQKIRADAEQELADKAYQKGLSDAWEAARKIASDNAGQNYSIFGQHFTAEILNTHSASEAIEEIRSYEQAQKEKEEQEEKDSVTVEEVMRQYLDTFCTHNKSCTECLLHTPDFTCGRGYHFITKNPISDEEVRRAYAAVLAKMKE